MQSWHQQHTTINFLSKFLTQRYASGNKHGLFFLIFFLTGSWPFLTHQSALLYSITTANWKWKRLPQRHVKPTDCIFSHRMMHSEERAICPLPHTWHHRCLCWTGESEYIHTAHRAWPVLALCNGWQWYVCYSPNSMAIVFFPLVLLISSTNFLRANSLPNCFYYSFVPYILLCKVKQLIISWAIEG